MMRLQRLLRTTDPGRYDIKYHVNKIKIKSWYTIECQGQLGPVSITATPWDGSVHFNWNEHAYSKYNTKLVEIAVPKSKRGFSSKKIQQALYNKFVEEIHEQDRQQKFRPFADELYRYSIKGKKIQVSIGNQVDTTNNTIQVSITGNFTLEEAKATFEGLYASHAVDEDLCRAIIES